MPNLFGGATPPWYLDGKGLTMIQPQGCLMGNRYMTWSGPEPLVINGVMLFHPYTWLKNNGFPQGSYNPEIRWNEWSYGTLLIPARKGPAVLFKSVTSGLAFIHISWNFGVYHLPTRIYTVVAKTRANPEKPKAPERLFATTQEEAPLAAESPETTQKQNTVRRPMMEGWTSITPRHPQSASGKRQDTIEQWDGRRNATGSGRAPPLRVGPALPYRVVPTSPGRRTSAPWSSRGGAGFLSGGPHLRELVARSHRISATAGECWSPEKLRNENFPAPVAATGCTQRRNSHLKQSRLQAAAPGQVKPGCHQALCPLQKFEHRHGDDCGEHGLHRSRAQLLCRICSWLYNSCTEKHSAGRCTQPCVSCLSLTTATLCRQFLACSVSCTCAPVLPKKQLAFLRLQKNPAHNSGSTFVPHGVRCGENNKKWAETGLHLTEWIQGQRGFIWLNANRIASRKSYIWEKTETLQHTLVPKRQVGGKERCWPNPLGQRIQGLHPIIIHHYDMPPPPHPSGVKVVPS